MGVAFVSTGITVTFSSGFFAEILDTSGPNASRVSLQISHMGTTTAHRFLPGKLVDWGEFQVELQFDPSTKPPVNNSRETVTVAYPDSGSSQWAFSAFMTGFDITASLEEIATASATLKVDGDVTVT